MTTDPPTRHEGEIDFFRVCRTHFSCRRTDIVALLGVRRDECEAAPRSHVILTMVQGYRVMIEPTGDCDGMASEDAFFRLIKHVVYLG